MQCPKCGCALTRVVDKRDTFDNKIRRRRKCTSCHECFTTYEACLADYGIFKAQRDTTDCKKRISASRRNRSKTARRTE